MLLNEVYPTLMDQVMKVLVLTFHKLIKRQCDYKTPNQAFNILDGVLSTPTRSKYHRRVEEKYDLEGSTAFIAWKKLHALAHSKDESMQICATPERTSTSKKFAIIVVSH